MGIGPLNYNTDYVSHLQDEELPDKNLSGGLKFLAERMKLRGPPLDVSTAKEIQIFNNFMKDLDQPFNSHSIHQLAKHFKERADYKQVFPKLPTMLKRYYKKWKMTQEIKMVKDEMRQPYYDLLRRLAGRRDPTQAQQFQKKEAEITMTQESTDGLRNPVIGEGLVPGGPGALSVGVSLNEMVARALAESSSPGSQQIQSAIQTGHDKGTLPPNPLPVPPVPAPEQKEFVTKVGENTGRKPCRCSGFPWGCPKLKRDCTNGPPNTCQHVKSLVENEKIVLPPAGEELDRYVKKFYAPIRAREMSERRKRKKQEKLEQKERLQQINQESYKRPRSG